MLGAVLALMFLPNFASADVTVAQLTLDYSTTTLRAYAAQVARDHDLDAARFVAVINCESSFRWDAVGDAGTSLGIVQLRFPERDWRVSSSTALDPYRAIEVMADAWTKGLENRWSCYALTRN